MDFLLLMLIGCQVPGLSPSAACSIAKLFYKVILKIVHRFGATAGVLHRVSIRHRIFSWWSERVLTVHMYIVQCMSTRIRVMRIWEVRILDWTNYSSRVWGWGKHVNLSKSVCFYYHFKSVTKEYISVIEGTAPPCVFQIFAHPTSRCSLLGWIDFKART